MQRIDSQIFFRKKGFFPINTNNLIASAFELQKDVNIRILRFVAFLQSRILSETFFKNVMKMFLKRIRYQY